MAGGLKLGHSWSDVGLSVVVAVISAMCIVCQTGGLKRVTFDAFRDLAWAENMAAGRYAGDPVLLDHPSWYAPGVPLIYVCVATVAAADILSVCETSPLWWNALIPVLLVLVIRRSSDTVTALAGVLMVWLGSLWWLTHLAAPIPSIQGIVPGLTSVILWLRSVECMAAGHRRALWWSIGSAVALGVTFWIHPVCAAMAAAEIAGHGLSIVLPRCQSLDVPRRMVLAQIAVVALVSFVVSLPLLLHLIRVPRVNLAPIRYSAAELWNPDFALQLHTPLILPLACVGVWYSVRARVRLGWLLGMGVAGLAGQALGYAGALSGAPVPWMVPHEFQWHTQLCTGILAAVGLVMLGRAAAARFRWPHDRRLALVLWIGGGFAAALTPALQFLPLSGSYLLEVERITRGREETVEWLRHSTAIDEVVACSPLLGHLVVAGLTGRKCVAVPPGHMNPASDATIRLADLSQLLRTGDEAEFVRIASDYRVSYIYVEVSTTEDAERISRLDRWRSTERAFEAERAPAVVFRVVNSGG